MKKKKQIEKEKISVRDWIDFIFPITDVLFKNALAIFITYYILTFLFQALYRIENIYGQVAISLIMIYVVLTWIIYLVRPVFDASDYKYKIIRIKK